MGHAGHGGGFGSEGDRGARRRRCKEAPCRTRAHGQDDAGSGRRPNGANDTCAPGRAASCDRGRGVGRAQERSHRLVPGRVRRLPDEAGDAVGAPERSPADSRAGTRPDHVERGVDGVRRRRDPGWTGPARRGQSGQPSRRDANARAVRMPRDRGGIGPEGASSTRGVRDLRSDPHGPGDAGDGRPGGHAPAACGPTLGRRAGHRIDRARVRFASRSLPRGGDERLPGEAVPPRGLPGRDRQVDARGRRARPPRRGRRGVHGRRIAFVLEVLPPASRRIM